MPRIKYYILPLVGTGVLLLIIIIIICKSNIHFFLFRFIQCLMSSKQTITHIPHCWCNETHSPTFLYIGACLSCLHVSTFTLHNIHVLIFIAQHVFDMNGWWDCYLLNGNWWAVNCDQWGRQNFGTKPLVSYKRGLLAWAINNFEV